MIANAESTAQPTVRDEAVLLHGQLMAVNWACGTAELYRASGQVVPLCFESVLNDAMRRLATRYVEIKGLGQLNGDDEWANVSVHQIGRAGGAPFDLDEFLNDPNPNLFDPKKVVTASEPFDVDEFVRIIHEGRDAGCEESST